VFLRGVTFDAVGVLIEPREPVGALYHRALAKHDPAAACGTTPAQIAARFSRAYNQPARYAAGSTRFHDQFWRGIVAASTGSDSPAVFDAVFEEFSRPSSWRVLPGAAEALARLRQSGMRLAVLSNNDSRLEPILQGLGLASLFDAVVVSAEVGAEKPSPVIFERALTVLQLAPSQCLHVGDDRLLDVWGARGAGLHAMLLGPGSGCDVRSLPALADRLLRHSSPSSSSPSSSGGGGVPFYYAMPDEDEDEDDDEDQEQSAY
jgi:REG-2-like HAD superfamily hydrolase